MSVRLELEGPYAGKTITLAGHRFVDGVLVLEGSHKDNEGIILYMRRCYQAKAPGDRRDEMTSVGTTRILLGGPHTGKTITLGGFSFVNGVMELEGTPDSNDGVIRYCQRCWQAKLDLGDSDGKRDVCADRPGEVPSDGGPDGEEPAKETPVNVEGDADPKADEGPGVRATRSGEEDGDIDPGDEVVVPENDEITELREVLADLDPDTDSHWSKAGAPAPGVVRMRMGVKVSPADIKAAWPEFDRDFARSLPVE